jgi:hypothetical protein
MPRLAASRLLRSTLLALLAAAALGAKPQVTQVPEGIWKGSYQGADGVNHRALAFVLGGARGGEARLIMANGDLAGLQLTAGGEGRGTQYREGGGSLQIRWQLERAQPRKRFQGVYQTSGDEGASLGHFLFDDFLAIYDLHTDQVALAGSYTSKPGQNSLHQELTFILKPDGNFKATGPAGMELEGALAVPDAQHSVFLANFRLNVPNHSTQDGTGLGYAFKDAKTSLRTILVTGDLGGRGLLATFQER